MFSTPTKVSAETTVPTEEDIIMKFGLTGDYNELDPIFIYDLKSYYLNNFSDRVYKLQIDAGFTCPAGTANTMGMDLRITWQFVIDHCLQ